jgi:bla regulator protein BlaR1
MVCVMLILAIAVSGCDLGTGSSPKGDPIADDPANGIISETTAARIFEYEEVPGGISIIKFKSASVLAAYLSSGGTFYLNKIGEHAVVSIAAGAFTPDPDNPDTDITTAVSVITLPSTITSIAADSFSGLGSTLTLTIPPEVYALLSDEVKQGLEAAVTVQTTPPVPDDDDEGETQSVAFSARYLYGRFPGTKTIDELHSAVGYPSYAEGKFEGLALYLDEALTVEISGATGITKNTILYVNREDAGYDDRVETYPGLDTSGWPQDNGLNTMNGTLYFRKSDDGKALACNPFGRGDDTNYIPDIWLVQEAGAGTFPVGVWVHMDGDQEEKLTFTGTQMTVDSPYWDTYIYDYTVSGSTFVCTNRQEIPYTPTAEDLAEIAAFNETAFRAARPWIPASSTITPQATKREIAYNVEDNPDMTFVNDPDVLGAWTTIDFVVIPEWFDPADTDMDDDVMLSSLTFAAGGSATCYYENGYTDSAAWTKNLLKMEDGDGVTAPTYEIQTLSGTPYLFVEHKSGDYTIRGQKPRWFVLKRP